MMRPSRLSTFAALRHRDYRLFWTGAVVSLVGTWMQSTAQSYLVWELTRSPLSTALTTLFFSLPSTVLSLVGGAIADRMDRRRLVFGTQSLFTVQAAILTALAFAGRIQVWHIYLLALFSGTVMAVDAPARQSLVPSLVEREDLTNAIALNSTAFNGARVFGPPLAGLVYAVAGPAWCFLLNTVSFLGILYPLAIIRPRPLERGPQQKVWHQVREGLTYSRRHAVILALLLMVALVGTFAFAYVVLMPVVASRVLGGGARENGFLIGSAGVGATIGALAVATLGNPRRPGKIITGFGLAGAVALVAFSLSRQLLLSMVLTAATAGAIIAFLSTCNSTIQAFTPDALRGRIMSLYTLALIGSGPLNALLAGALANALGAPMAIAISGALMAVSVALIASRYRVLLDLDTTETVAEHALQTGSGAVLEPAGRGR
jgi:MFS family permease